MSFAAILAVWQNSWNKTAESASAFCDWIRDNGHLDNYWLDPLQRWLTNGGLSFFEAELSRLATAESAHFAKEDAGRGKKAP